MPFHWRTVTVVINLTSCKTCFMEDIIHTFSLETCQMCYQYYQILDWLRNKGSYFFLTELSQLYFKEVVIHAFKFSLENGFNFGQLHKNVASNIEQVLVATPHKASTIRPPAPITKTIQVRWTRHAGHYWRSRDVLISDVLLWTPHMARQKQDDQLEHTFSSYVSIRDVALKTYQRRWTIGRGGERGSGISVPAAWHDDDEKQLDMFLGG